MKNAILIGSVAALIALPAFAAGRANSMSYTCEAAQALIARQGAVVFTLPSRSNASLYDRFVRDRGSCNFSEYAASVSIPTKDNRSCPAYVCRSSSELNLTR